MNLSKNKFSGKITVSLKSFDLSDNDLTRSVPGKMSALVAMEGFNLSRNGLSGELPSDLTSMTFLSLFDVSYNNFSGPIPSGLQFETFTNESYLGNPYLCGPPLSISCNPGSAGNGTMTGKGNSTNVGVIIGGVVAGVVVLAVVAVVVLGYVLRLSRKKARLARESEEDSFLQTLPGLPPRYSKKDLDGATIGFTKVLGSGGFGSVYEGILKDGSMIAVKKLKCSKDTKDFRAEMATLGNIHHINLVSLRGFCAEGAENMLVYEYMSKGSLDRWLFSNDLESTSLISNSLDWETRFKIALGTARGLAYLHQACSERIIHLDVKPQNILLDDDFNPKIADFGLSKLMDRDLSKIVTTMRGTPGYLAPEWLLEAAVTDRTDVYSYGIVLIELVAGRKCSDISQEDPKRRYVPAWLLQCILQGNILDIVDPRLDINDGQEQITKVLHIGLQCIQEEMMHRPSMEGVVKMLEGLVPVPDFQRDKISTKYRFFNFLESICPANNL